MKDIGKRVRSRKATSSAVNTDAPAESLTVEQSQSAIKAVEPHEGIQKRQQDKNLDHWMENIKKFIRNIDVKTL